MTCLTCHWTHTSFERALACYRAAFPAPGRVVAGTPSAPASAPTTSTGSVTVLRHGRAGRPGRPKVDAATQRQKHVERSRAYRQRQNAAQAAANDALLAVVQA
jgi:hypothetical protein